MSNTHRNRKIQTIIKTTTALGIGFAMATMGLAMGEGGPIDLEARKATIPFVERRIEEREAQVAEIANDILGLHKRLDARLDRMVGQLSGIKDSARSGYRIGKLKMEAIGQLQKTVETFRATRAAQVAEFQKGRSEHSAEMVKAEAGHLDSHVEDHIAQMLKISKSFTQDENVEKYETVGGGGYYDSGYGWYDDVVEISDEWKQNRRDRSMDSKQRDQVTDALKESVEHCERRVNSLRNDLKADGSSTARREVIQQELDTHLAMLETRRRQLDELLIVDKPETVEVSRDVARDLEEAIGDLVDDLQRDLRLIVLKHSQLNREQSKLKALKDNLEARKHWIAEYEKGQSK